MDIVAGEGKDDGVVTTLIPAAEYRRASDEDQKYSTENQSLANRTYAATHGMVIVRTYSDEGKSGLNFTRRDALKRLIADVEGGDIDFKVILVYDVSRWGRFQDLDESAYYEYVCKRAGVRVIYCAELFENDDSPFSALFKTLKRAAAADYSRELSVKVFAGQARLVRLGYKLGGSPGFGLRRLLVNHQGKPKCVLAHGERKNIQSDRILLVPGSPEELETVRWIFHAFAKQGKTEAQIADLLNQRGIPNVRGGQWQYDHVRRTLKNENYIGNIVWNRQSFKLKQRIVNNDPSTWIRFERALPPIVERSVFEAAQRIMRGRTRELTQEEKLAPLRRLLRKHGTLNARLINRANKTPSAATYHRWFGSLLKAYELVGFTERAHCKDGRPRRSLHKVTLALSNDDILLKLSELYQAHGRLSQQIIDWAKGVPSAGTVRRRFGSLDRAYELIGLRWDLANRPPPRRPYRCRVSLSDKQLLEKLRLVLRTYGRITRKLLDETEGVPYAGTYQRRFGGVTHAYDQIGYTAKQRARRSASEATRNLSNMELLKKLRRLVRKHGHLTARLIDAAKGLPASSTYRRRFRSMTRAYQLAGHAPKARHGGRP